MQIAFPFSISERGRAATADYDDHVYQLIYQLLFTEQGERVNRTGFGCSVQSLVFAPGGAQLTSSTQALIHSALQQWLGDIIRVEAVQVVSDEAMLTITIQYTVLRTQSSRVKKFQRQRIS
jgi:phage baseplate assembly protein W